MVNNRSTQVFNWRNLWPLSRNFCMNCSIMSIIFLGFSLIIKKLTLQFILFVDWCDVPCSLGLMVFMTHNRFHQQWTIPDYDNSWEELWNGFPFPSLWFEFRVVLLDLSFTLNARGSDWPCSLRNLWLEMPNYIFIRSCKLINVIKMLTFASIAHIVNTTQHDFLMSWLFLTIGKVMKQK